MITAVSGTVCEEVIDYLVAQMGWASLHTERPDFSSASESEYFAPSYGRARVEWERLGSGVATNHNILVWDGLEPPVQIAAIGFMAQPNGYQLAAYGMLDPQLRLQGSVWRLPAHQVTLRLA